jgi:N-acetylglucosamine-6-phosphate deacetylase
VTHLGGRPILVTDKTATLEDGTLAGSVLTMDGAFRVLVGRLGLSLVDAARLCATTPARQLKAHDTGTLEVGALADVVVLDRNLAVRHTFVAGHEWRNSLSDRHV